MAMLDLICINSITSPFPSPAVIPPPLASLERTESKDRREGICEVETGRTFAGKGSAPPLSSKKEKKNKPLFSIHSIHMLYCQQSICSSKPSRLNVGQTHTKTHKKKIFSYFFQASFSKKLIFMSSLQMLVFLSLHTGAHVNELWVKMKIYVFIL